MNVFLDTGVLVSAFGTRGLSADVLRHVLVEHELVLADVVLRDLERALRRQLHLPRGFFAPVMVLLRPFAVKAAPSVRARSSRAQKLLAVAVSSGADVLVTGDRRLLRCAPPRGLWILTPRGFWEHLRRHRSGALA